MVVIYSWYVVVIYSWYILSTLIWILDVCIAEVQFKIKYCIQNMMKLKIVILEIMVKIIQIMATV